MTQRDNILGVLKRGEETGEHISEAEIGRELGLEPTQVADELRDLAVQGAVSRTASGNYELTPAASMHVQARPHPREPR
jgi:DNA-binding IclR family transcriptional regulator